jgi:hypothetical protein
MRQLKGAPPTLEDSHEPVLQPFLCIFSNKKGQKKIILILKY